MKTTIRLFLTFTTLSLLAFAVTPISAQESDEYEDDSRLVRIFFEGEVWVPQATGNEWNPTYEFNPDTGFRRVLSPTNGTQQDIRSRLGIKLAKNLGTVIFTHFANDDEVSLAKSTPGSFNFGELLVPAVFAGYGNNGLADAFEMAGATRMSDIRIDFYRTAFENKRVSADWFVGVRRTKHSKSTDVIYYGLLPDFDVVMPDRFDPRPDIVATTSSFEGRGLEAGMDFRMPMLNNRLTFDAGFAIGALRGDIESQYSSITHFYYFDGTNADLGEGVLEYPYNDVFSGTYIDPFTSDEEPLADLISQRDFRFGLENGKQSRNSQFMETYFRLRYRVRKTIHVFGGFRSVRYDDVYLQLRPGAATGTNYEGLVEVNQSAAYEGFFGGLDYTF